MRKRHIMASGMASLAADTIAGQVNAALVGAGTTQADATPISQDANEFITVASGTGARLTALEEIGDTMEVYNYGANALLVYPPTGLNINALAVNAGFSVAAGGKAAFRRLTTTRIGAFLSA